MMDPIEIIEVMESTAPGHKGKGFGEPMVTADAADIRLWRDSLMRFLEELDTDLSIGEVMLALEEWTS
jgi:hypothetical protein